MKHLILTAGLFLFLSKSYSQQEQDTAFVPSSFFTVSTTDEINSITDRRLIGVTEVYLIQNGVTIVNGFTVDPERGIIYIPTPSNSKTTIIYKK